MDSVSLGSAEEPYVPDMTHSYRLTEGRLIRYPLTRPDSVITQWVDLDIPNFVISQLS